MDEDDINSLIEACKILKYKFCGVSLQLIIFR